jgi:hypothetical protein
LYILQTDPALSKHSVPQEFTEGAERATVDIPTDETEDPDVSTRVSRMGKPSNASTCRRLCQMRGGSIRDVLLLKVSGNA